MRKMLLTAALSALPGAALAASPGVGLGQQYPQACASGYHPDAAGNCQPNVGETNRFCPPGLVYQPTPDGWDCNPAPPEAY